MTHVLLSPTLVSDLASQPNCFNITDVISKHAELIRTNKGGLKLFYNFSTGRKNITALSSKEYLEVIIVDNDPASYLNDMASSNKIKELHHRFKYMVGFANIAITENNESFAIVFSEYNNTILGTLLVKRSTENAIVS